MEKKSNHQVNIVKLKAPRVHTNADSLELFDIGGYQVVVKKGEFKEGDLAVYIQPDSVIPQTESFRFIWEGQIGLDGVVPEKRRRITVRRFRKEWSEGLLMPVKDFFVDIDAPVEGDDVADLLGITHYEPETLGSTVANTAVAPHRKYPKSLKGWFYFILFKLGFTQGGLRSWALEVDFESPVFDVEALKNYMQAFREGEPIIATEKIHGSNARYLFLDDVFYVGSHRQWKKKDGGCIWWKVADQNPWIEEWCRNNPGDILYGEVTPTQKGFNYGSCSEHPKFFAFAIRRATGAWEKPYSIITSDLDDPLFTKIIAVKTLDGIKSIVPIITAAVPFDYAELKKLAEGPSIVTDANHIREGIVVTPVEEREVHRLGRLILKLVSNSFLEKDSK